MTPTPKLEADEYFVRWVMHAGDGPLADDGETVIGCRSAREAAEASADIAYRDMAGENPTESGEGIHLDVEDAAGNHSQFYVRCEFKVTWQAEPYLRPDFSHLVRKVVKS